VTDTDAHTGTYSATNTNNIELRQNFAAVSTGSIVELSFWAKHIGAGDAMAVGLFYSDASAEQTIVDVPESDWLFFDVTSALDPGKSLVGFSVFGNSTGCPGVDCTRSFLDDVTLTTTPIPLPAALPMFAAALAGFGLIRRRCSV
jgi:hypothetical protein